MRRFCILFFLCATTVGQSEQPNTLPLNDCTHRSIVVSIAEDSMPIEDFDNFGFTATLGSQPLKVISIKPLANPARVLLLLDTSRAMGNYVTRTASAINSLMSSLSGNTPFAFAVISNKFEMRAAFSSQIHDTNLAVNSGLNEVLGSPKSWKGSTALSDAIAESIKAFGEPRPGDTIVIFSDGGEGRRKTDNDELRRLLINSGVRLHLCLVYIVNYAIRFQLVL
jgi:hypothetical protein